MGEAAASVDAVLEEIDAVGVAGHPAALYWRNVHGAVLRDVTALGRVEFVSESSTGAVLRARSMPNRSARVARVNGGGDPDPLRGGGGPRGEIREFSYASRRRLGWLVARLVAVAVGRSSAFVSLTYGLEYPCGEAVKRDLAVLKKRLARAHPGVCGVWVLEFQRRGAPHLHALLLLDGVSVDAFRSWCSTAWLDITGLGGSSARARGRRAVNVEAVTSAGELLSYLITELSGRKAHQKAVPDGFGWVGRWWGYVGGRDAVLDALAPVESVELDGDVVAGRLRELDGIMRPLTPGVAVGDGPRRAVVTWPAETVNHLAARYLVSGDVLDLVAFREAVWSGRRDAVLDATVGAASEAVSV